MSDSSSERLQAGVGGTYYPFSMPSDTRAPVDRGGPVIRRSIVNDAELGKSIVLTVALPAFAVGCLVGMLL